MPTVHKSQLEHASFCWHEQSSRFHADLQVQKAEILERSGFNAEFGDWTNGTSAGAEKEGADFLLELSGVLSQAAAIKMDSGFKPANKVSATLKSIRTDPSVVLAGAVEPEALAMVASNYQRGNERPGTFWFDVDRAADAPLPDPQHVSKAASVAIDQLSARRGNRAMSCWISSEINCWRVFCASTLRQDGARSWLMAMAPKRKPVHFSRSCVSSSPR